MLHLQKILIAGYCRMPGSMGSNRTSRCSHSKNHLTEASFFMWQKKTLTALIMQSEYGLNAQSLTHQKTCQCSKCVRVEKCLHRWANYPLLHYDNRYRITPLSLSPKGYHLKCYFSQAVSLTKVLWCPALIVVLKIQMKNAWGELGRGFVLVPHYNACLCMFNKSFLRFYIQYKSKIKFFCLYSYIIVHTAI